MKRIFSICFACAMLLAPVCSFAQNAQDVLAKFSHEPSVEATMAAASEYAGLDSDRLESLYHRAGAANALPKNIYYELQYRDRDTERPQTVYTYTGEDAAPNKYTDYKENQKYTQHKVHAQWDLSKLIFNSDQRGVVSVMNQAVKTRDKLLKDVSKAYFARRRAQIELELNPPKNVAEKLEADLKIQEMTASLDAMTGGWFSAQLRHK
ncbi:MAG: hypothetical protein IKY83_02370 [Proteobacteria bacterium]|nr:hypothetical protein [Pseudomonadota bacterium]